MRELSGIYFREKIDGKWCNVCFEELSKKKQEDILEKNNHQFACNLALQLADTLNYIGNTFDIHRG